MGLLLFAGGFCVDLMMSSKAVPSLFHEVLEI